jgi:LPXTG-motif cell wall-anchored protein
MGAGTSSYKVAAGNVYTQWFGTAQGPLDAGVYSLEIQFSPSAGGSQVPLPTSVGLLLSGLGLLVWQRRTRAGDSSAQSATMSGSQSP